MRKGFVFINEKAIEKRKDNVYLKKGTWIREIFKKKSFFEGKPPISMLVAWKMS